MSRSEAPSDPPIESGTFLSLPLTAQQERTTSKWAVLAIVGVGVFMATLDSSIVNISLPAIATYFGVPLNGAVEWVVIAYLVMTAATLLTIGRLADMIGRKPIWIAGLVIFTAGSAICGAAPSLVFLVAARGFQGLGCVGCEIRSGCQFPDCVSIIPSNG